MNKDSAFFKSSKNFWSFYKKYIKTKNSQSQNIDTITLSDDRVVNSNSGIAQEFNKFISDLSLPNSVSEEESSYYIDDSFNNLKTSNKLSISSSFSLDRTNATEVLDLLSVIDNTRSPGITGIPIKIIKHCSMNFSRISSDFINRILVDGQIPI